MVATVVATGLATVVAMVVVTGVVMVVELVDVLMRAWMEGTRTMRW